MIAFSLVHGAIFLAVMLRGPLRLCRALAVARLAALPPHLATADVGHDRVSNATGRRSAPLVLVVDVLTAFAAWSSACAPNARDAPFSPGRG